MVMRALVLVWAAAVIALASIGIARRRKGLVLVALLILALGLLIPRLVLSLLD